ncbi:MAG: hypothetical protein K0S65_4769 [Labilithrix sp.]|nr:hypothetical protein [Labilithrix sp.]
MNVEVNVEDRILKPSSEVFAAIVDPTKLARYFVSRASGPMKTGTTVEWEFGDVGVTGLVDVIEVEEGRKVVFESVNEGVRTRVTISLKPVDAESTLVAINEADWPMDATGVKLALGQTAGWTYFLCCLKAWAQHGIDLRFGLTKRLTDV